VSGPIDVTTTAMFEVEAYILLAKVVTLSAGGFVTLLAFRASARTGSPALRALAVGLGFVTAGGILGGAVHLFTRLGIAVGVAIQSTATAIGFAVLSYSLYAAGTDGEPADVDRIGPT
jgi:hypothetical protein